MLPRKSHWGEPPEIAIFPSSFRWKKLQGSCRSGIAAGSESGRQIGGVSEIRNYKRGFDTPSSVKPLKNSFTRLGGGRFAAWRLSSPFDGDCPFAWFGRPSLPTDGEKPDSAGRPRFAPAG
jgi:hypothetical protein